MRQLYAEPGKTPLQDASILIRNGRIVSVTTERLGSRRCGCRADGRGRPGDQTAGLCDFYGQALAKIERGHAMDLEDVRQMHGRGLIDQAELASQFDAIASDIVRYPASEPDAFQAKVQRFTGGRDDAQAK